MEYDNHLNLLIDNYFYKFKNEKIDIFSYLKKIMIL